VQGQEPVQHDAVLHDACALLDPTQGGVPLTAIERVRV